MCQNLSYCCEFSKLKKSNFRVLIKHCFLMGKNTVQAKQWLGKCYSDSATSETTIKRCYADFKRGRTNTNDLERSRHSNLVVAPENTKKTPQSRLADRKLKLREIADDSKISEVCVFTILQWTFVNEKAVFKVSAVFAHSRSKTTMCSRKNSVFCLARKLTWPLWSSHIFTLWEWLMPFSTGWQNAALTISRLLLSHLSSRMDPFHAGLSSRTEHTFSSLSSSRKNQST